MVVLASTSSASVRLGQTPVRNPAQLTAWSPITLPGRERVRLVTIARESLNGSSGFRIGVNSKPAPTVLGVHCCMMAPLGKYTTPKRIDGIAAAFPCGVKAGTIASRNGRAMVAPAPRKTVRRETDFMGYAPVP